MSDKREKTQHNHHHRLKNVIQMKIDLLTNATVIEYAVGVWKKEQLLKEKKIEFYPLIKRIKNLDSMSRKYSTRLFNLDIYFLNQHPYGIEI